MPEGDPGSVGPFCAVLKAPNEGWVVYTIYPKLSSGRRFLLNVVTAAGHSEDVPASTPPPTDGPLSEHKLQSQDNLCILVHEIPQVTPHTLQQPNPLPLCIHLKWI